MPTIVEYTDTRPAENRYPTRILSPSRPSACCESGMEAVGKPYREGQWRLQYRRCRTCGYAVRRGLELIPNEGLFSALRRVMATAFVRDLAGGNRLRQGARHPEYMDAKGPSR
jgi:hypothetical protein